MKQYLLLLAFGTNQISFGQNVTSSSTPVISGQTVLLRYGPATGSRLARQEAPPVQWSLTGPGTLVGPNPSNSIQYTAPNLIPNHAMFGCSVLPNDTIFNAPIGDLPADPNSAQKLNRAYAISNAPITIEPAWGISFADSSTPLQDLRSYYDSVVHTGFPIPIGPNLRRENGNQVGIFSFIARLNNPPDHHVLTVRPSDCSFFETYMDTQGFSRTCRDGTPGCAVNSAVKYNSGTYAINGGTDAAGLLLAPLTWHLDEIESGEIKHAGRMTNNGYFMANAYIWPASASAGGMTPCTFTSCLQLGNRLRLRSDFNTQAVCNSGISAQDRACGVMLTALQRYGVFLADTGTNNGIQVADDLSEDPIVFAALSSIENAHIEVTSANFDVIDESSLEVSPTSYQTCPYNEQCMGVRNSFVSNQDQVIVTAAPFGGPQRSLTLAILGAAIGLGVPVRLPIVVGNYSFKIPYWIKGLVNGSVSWAKESGVGTVSDDGTYTPPPDTAGGTASVLVATSNENPNVTSKIFVTILPTNSSGVVQIDTGSFTSTKDSLGNVWSADPGINGVTGGFDNSDWPNWTTGDPARMIYQTRDRSLNDLRLTAVMPNGNYVIHLMFGTLFNGCPTPCTSWLVGSYDTGSFGPTAIESQGVVATVFNYGLPISYQYATPADVFVPAQVTSGLLQIGVLPYAPDFGANFAPAHGSKINTINGIEVLPFKGTPHWVIDSGQLTSIAPGGSVQLSIIDYFTGSTSARWSVSQGPGAVDSAGVLQLPLAPYSPGANILVLATSTLNTAVSAMLQLTVTSSTASGAQQQQSGLKAATAHLVKVVVKTVWTGLRRFLPLLV